MNKSQTKVFQAMFAANLPILESLITGVCEKLGHADQIEEMKTIFLYQDKKKFTKILNKKHTTNKRRKTAYTMFLSDKTVLTMLRERFPDHTLSELNKEKGVYYRTEVQGTALYEQYKAQADEVNGPTIVIAEKEVVVIE